MDTSLNGHDCRGSSQDLSELQDLGVSSGVRTGDEVGQT